METSQGLDLALDPWEILLLVQSLPGSMPSSISTDSLEPASSSSIPVSCDLKGADLGACFRRQTYNSGHVWCHLEGRSAFPKWKQCALKVIMGQKACSGAKPSILKQRLPFLPGGQPRKDKVNPISPQLWPSGPAISRHNRPDWQWVIGHGATYHLFQTLVSNRLL